MATNRTIYFDNDSLWEEFGDACKQQGTSRSDVIFRLVQAWTRPDEPVLPSVPVQIPVLLEKLKRIQGILEE